MIKQTLEFSAKKGAQLFPVALNTFHSAIDPAQLLPNEVVINKDVIRTPNGELTTHPRWKHISLTGCTRIITDYYIKTAFIEEQFLVFGHYDDGGTTKGFVGRIKSAEVKTPMFTIEKLITNLNPNTVPQFVSYLKGIYIFLGSEKLQFYDGVEVTDPGGGLTDKLAIVGCTLHGRLFYVVVESPGKVQMTTIGTETHDSDILCGDIGEQITGLTSTDESLLIFKDREFHEFNYGLNISEGELKTRSRKVGCSYHTLLQKKFGMIYTMNRQGVYIINPKYVKAIGREVVVDPGIIDIGLPVKDKITSLNIPGYIIKLWLEDEFDAGDYTSVDLTFGDKIENEKSPEGTIEQFLYYDFDWIIKETYYYSQSFRHIGSGQIAKQLREMHIWQDENNPITSNVYVELCEDFGGAPGSILKDKDGEDAQVELEPGDIPVGWPGIHPWIDFNEVSLDKNTTYWIQVRFKSNTGSEKIFWHFEHYAMPGVHYIYANGRMSTDDPAWGEELLAASDARFQIRGFYYKPSGWLISNNPITISGISEWKTFSVSQNVGTHCTIDHYIREFNVGSWIAINPDDNIPDALKHVTQLQWKAEFSTADYNYNYKSSIDTVWFTGVCVGDGKPLVSGLREDRYYIFGKDTSDNNVFLCFAKDGWLNIDESDDNFIYGQCHDDIEVNNFKILGVGRAVDDNKGCLLYALDSNDSDYLNMPIHIKTGRLLLDKIPKKGRKIFIVYQGKNVVVKCYTEHDMKTFNLADAEDSFNTEEFGFGTARSKYFELEIMADKNFKKKELGLIFKTHKAQEV